MGRKVHPIGFRLKSIRDWNTRWYAEGERYRDLLLEDFEIRRRINEELPQAGISHVEIERFPNQVQVTVWTSKPGIVIGRKGATVKALRGMLRDLTDKAVKLEVEEIADPDLDAQLIAENIAGQLERRIAHGRAMKRAAAQAIRQGAEGVRIEAAGRLRLGHGPHREGMGGPRAAEHHSRRPGFRHRRSHHDFWQDRRESLGIQGRGVAAARA